MSKITAEDSLVIQMAKALRTLHLKHLNLTKETAATIPQEQWKMTGTSKVAVKNAKKEVISYRDRPIALDVYMRMLMGQLPVNQNQQAFSDATALQIFHFVLSHPVYYELMMQLLQMSNRCELAWQKQDKQKRKTFTRDLEAWNRVCSQL
jgi:hypothetical protein